MKECTKCGYEMGDSTMFCPKCGAKQDNYSKGEKESAKLSSSSFNETVERVYNSNSISNTAKKSNSPLSVTACVLSGVAFIIPIPFFVSILMYFLAFIFALIDLGINNKEQRHFGSGVALMFCTIITIYMLCK